MKRESIFDLAERKFEGDPFDTAEKCRTFDLDMRTSMIIPMQHMLTLLEPFCKPGAKLLDVGCGSGLLSLRLAGKFPEVEVYGVDQNDAFLQVAQENLIFSNLICAPGNFRYEWGRFNKIPIQDHSVDVVFGFCSLHRCKNPEKVLKECNRVVKDDGVVILYDLARDAEDGMVSFILQYTGAGHEDFMTALGASLTVPEAQQALQNSECEGWYVSAEAINLIITNKEIDTTYSVGDRSIYDNIFNKEPSVSASAA